MPSGGTNDGLPDIAAAPLAETTRREAWSRSRPRHWQVIPAASVFAFMYWIVDPESMIGTECAAGGNPHLAYEIRQRRNPQHCHPGLCGARAGVFRRAGKTSQLCVKCCCPRLLPLWIPGAGLHLAAWGQNFPHSQCLPPKSYSPGAMRRCPCVIGQACWCPDYRCRVGSLPFGSGASERCPSPFLAMGLPR